MKKINLILLFAIFFATINGCKKNEPEQEKDEINLKKINYTIELPSNVNSSLISDYKLSNAYGDFDLQITNNRNTSSGNIISTVEVLEEGGYQINYLVNSQGKPVMCSVADIENVSNGDFIMSARTTALTMLLSHPLLITTSPIVKNKIEQLIVTMPSFNTYLNDVENLIRDGISQHLSPDFTSPASYKQTIIEVLNNNMENFNLGAPNGMLEVNLVERNNGILKYTVTNHHKRVLHIYPKKVWVDPNTGITTQEEAFEEFGLPKIELLPSKGLNLLNSTWALASGDDISIFEVTSDILEADISAADKLKLEIYGIGQLDTPFDQLSQEEQLKIILVGIHGGIQDFIIPSINLFLGIKNYEMPGETNQKFDFRYGSKKEPLIQLIKKLKDAFISDPNQLVELKNRLQNQDYTGIIYQFAYFTFDQIIGDRQPANVRDRYINNLYDIFKDIMGVSSTNETFRRYVKKAANQFSAIWRANFVSNTIAIAELATDVAGAIVAYYDSDYRNIFYINKTSQTMINLVSPPDNYIVPSNETAILFDWEFDRGNYIGNISYELIIDEVLQNGTTTTHTYQSTSTSYYTVPLTDFDSNSSSFSWKVKVLNTQGSLLVESNMWHFSTLNNNMTVTDYDGNVYETVQIGSQIWMKSNLKVTHYADGTPISLVTSNTDWANLPDDAKAYCWYDNDISNKDDFGALYTYNAAINGSSLLENVQGVCPDGWHIPSQSEIVDFRDYLTNTYGVNYTAGALKQTGYDYWLTPNTNATNSTDFSSVGSGYRSGNDGIFSGQYEFATFHKVWSYSSLSGNFSQAYNNGQFINGTAGKTNGRSCRCIKN